MQRCAGMAADNASGGIWHDGLLSYDPFHGVLRFLALHLPGMCRTVGISGSTLLRYKCTSRASWAGILRLVRVFRVTATQFPGNLRLTSATPALGHFRVTPDDTVSHLVPVRAVTLFGNFTIGQTHRLCPTTTPSSDLHTLFLSPRPPPSSSLNISTLIGPWWLITDDLRTFFRTWSTPVHRWLVSCVHTPILSCGMNVNNGASKKNGRTPNFLPEVTSTDVARAGDVPTACVPTGGDPANSSADLMKGGESPTAAASTNGEGFGVGQTPSGELGSQDGIGKAGTATSGWRLLALVSVFMFSSVVHEVVLFVAMRRTCWPINSFSLMTSVVFVAAWDKIFPPKYLIHEDSKRTEVEVGVDSEGGGLMSRRLVGSEWRGWGAVVHFQSTSIPVTLLFDFFCWQWWRHAYLRYD